jgi:cytochrome c peroxidase
MPRLPTLLFALLLPFVTTSAQQGGPPGPLQPPPVPSGNPLSPAKVNLGKTLYWDEQMSSTRTVACGTCHVPAAGSSDPRSVFGSPRSTHPGADGQFGTLDDITGSPGVPSHLASGDYLDSALFGLREQVTTRKARSVVNAAYASELFGDGRVDDVLVDPLDGAVILAAGAALENQVLGPPLSSVEMSHVGADWDDIVARLRSATPLVLSPAVPPPLATWIAGREYPELFDEAFGTRDIDPVRIAMAIASYERTLVSDQTPFDDALAGVQPLLPLEAQGRQLFNQLNCNACHRGNRLTDDRFHYTGVRPANQDLGRFSVTGNPPDRGAFRTPGLRNVALRGPYMHTGQFQTLEEVIDFYDRGGDFQAPNKSPLIVPLGLTAQDKAALLAFLQRPLTDLRVENELPPFARPQLYGESNLTPNHIGSGTPGSGGVVPRAIAFEPLWIDNPSFTLAMQRGLGGAPAFLMLDIAPSPAGTPFLSVTSHLALTPALAIVPVGALSGIGPGNGFTSLSLSLALDPALIGLNLFGQWLVQDPGPPAGAFSATEAVRLTLF